MTLEEIKQNFPSIVEINVAWGEMDAAQHVNNIVYLRYSEIGRITFFEKMGFTVNTAKENNNIGPILAEISCKYKYPVTYPDQVIVASRVLEESFDEYSFWVEQWVFSKKANRLAAEIRAKIVGYDYTNLKKAAILQDLKSKLIGG